MWGNYYIITYYSSIIFEERFLCTSSLWCQVQVTFWSPPTYTLLHVHAPYAYDVMYLYLHAYLLYEHSPAASFNHQTFEQIPIQTKGQDVATFFTSGLNHTHSNENVRDLWMKLNVAPWTRGLLYSQKLVHRVIFSLIKLLRRWMNSYHNIP